MHSKFGDIRWRMWCCSYIVTWEIARTKQLSEQMWARPFGIFLILCWFLSSQCNATCKKEGEKCMGTIQCCGNTVCTINLKSKIGLHLWSVCTQRHWKQLSIAKLCPVWDKVPTMSYRFKKLFKFCIFRIELFNAFSCVLKQKANVMWSASISSNSVLRGVQLNLTMHF